MNYRRTLVAFAFSVLPVAAKPTFGQSSGSSICYLRIQPAPQCEAYIVTEAAVEFPFGSTKVPSGQAAGIEDYFDPRFTATVGVMKNLAPDHAVGGVVAWDFQRGWAAPFRGEVRYRKWLPHLAALDVSAGITRKGIQSVTPLTVANATGLSGGIGFDWRYIGADIRGEVLNGEGRAVRAGFIGAHASSVGAPVALLISGLVITAYALSGGAY